MSQSPAVGVVPVENWHCMATQMNQALLRVIKGNLTIENFPQGVLADAEAFVGSAYEEVLCGVLGTIPSNPPASINNYAFASGAYRAMPLPILDDISGRTCDEALGWISQCLAILRRPHELTGREKEVLGEVAIFFNALAALSKG